MRLKVLACFPLTEGRKGFVRDESGVSHEPCRTDLTTQKKLFYLRFRSVESPPSAPSFVSSSPASVVVGALLTEEDEAEASVDSVLGW